MPTEVWYGETDVLVPAAHGRWLAANVPGTEVVIQHDEGHMGNPDQILNRIRRLVESSQARR